MLKLSMKELLRVMSNKKCTPMQSFIHEKLPLSNNQQKQAFSLKLLLTDHLFI